MRFHTWLWLGGSVAVLGALVWILDLRAIASAIDRLSVVRLLSAFLIAFAIVFAMAWRWLVIIQPLAPLSDTPSISSIYYVATFLNTFTPANLGRDAYRVLALRSPEGGISPVVVGIVREHLIGLLTYLCAAPFLLALAYLQEAPI